MPKFEKLTLPNEGEIITFNQGKPNVPNNPIVPFIRGDGYLLLIQCYAKI